LKKNGTINQDAASKKRKRKFFDKAIL